MSDDGVGRAICKGTRQQKKAEDTSGEWQPPVAVLPYHSEKWGKASLGQREWESQFLFYKVGERALLLVFRIIKDRSKTKTLATLGSPAEGNGGAGGKGLSSASNELHLNPGFAIH